MRRRFIAAGSLAIVLLAGLTAAIWDPPPLQLRLGGGE